MDEINIKPLNFKPMTEGLGLNHFSDGLPYAPVNSKKKTPVQFNFPPPRKNAPAPSAPTVAAIEPVFISPELVATQVEYAGFIRRVMAFAVDLFFSTLIFSTIVWASFYLNGLNLVQMIEQNQLGQGVQMFWPLTLLYLVVHLGYFLIQETTWQKTIGKALFGMRIRSASGFSTLARSVCFFIALLPFGVGLFWYFFDSKHRCWHDVITDSEVVTA